MHINSPRTAPKKSTKQKKTKKKQQKKKKKRHAMMVYKDTGFKKSLSSMTDLLPNFFFFHCFGIYCFFFFFYISFIVSQYPFSLLSSFPRVVLFVFLVLLLPFSPNMFFFCFIIIACCRTFLICISSRISHPDFDFLFVFIRGRRIDYYYYYFTHWSFSHQH